MDVPLRSVDTPVANSPRDATASEPPKSTILAMVPPWRMLRRFCGLVLVCGGQKRRGDRREEISGMMHTVWCFSIGSSNLTTPGRAAVTRSYFDADEY
jgi:hypothetical protein